MDNLLPLPEGKTAATAPKKLSDHLSWHPEKADPRDNANIPFGLMDVKDGVNEYEVKYGLNEPPLAAPNKRNLDNIAYDKEVTPSPLGALHRGEAEPAMIAMPKSDDLSLSSSRSLRARAAPDNEIYVSVSNLMPDIIDAYMQRAGSISTYGLRPNMQCNYNLSQRVSAIDAKPSTSTPLSVLLSPMEKVCVTMTARHALRSFHFVPGPIGMEIEFKYDRLICTKILPNSQASVHSAVLLNTEIVSVNGLRVTSLTDFQNAVIDATEYGEVTITAVAFKVGKVIDNFHAQFTAAKKEVVKSLFGGLLQGGVDADHSHGMELPTAKDDSDSDSDRSSSGSSSSGEEEEEKEERKGGEAEGGASGRVPGGDPKPIIAESKDDEGVEGEDEDRLGAFSGSQDSDSDSDDDDDNITSIRQKPISSSPFGSNKAEAKTGPMMADEDGDQLMMAKSQRRDAGDLDDKEGTLEDFKFPGEDLVDDEKDEEDDETEMGDSITELGSSSLVSVEKIIDKDMEVETWNYATALDVEELVPYSRLVCVPDTFMRSEEWGIPQKHIQFTNYSDHWEVRVCWVDEEGSLVHRITLSPEGLSKHVELTSTKHVWCLAAYAFKPDNDDKKMDIIGDVSHHEPTAVMLIKPSKEALVDSNFVCMTWKPWQSLFATQKARPKEVPAHYQDERLKVPDEIRPDIMVSVMDDGLMKK